MELPVFLLNIQTITNGDMSGNLTSSVTEIKEARRYGVQLIYTGTPTGTLKLQGSNDNTNWTDLTSQSVSLTGSAGSKILTDDADYSFVRTVYVFGSGTGTLNTIITAKR